MASTTAICTSFKVDLLNARHNFGVGQHAFYWALYDNVATHDATTTAYSATNEITGTNYVAKGETVANNAPTNDSTTAILDWPNPTWTGAAFSAYSTLLYNDTITTPVADASVAVWDFGGVQTASGGDFVLVLPAPAAATAAIRLA